MGQAVFEPTRRLLWRATAISVVLLCLGSMVAAPGHPLYEKHVRNEAAKARNGQIREANELLEAPVVETPPVFLEAPLPDESTEAPAAPEASPEAPAEPSA